MADEIDTDLSNGRRSLDASNHCKDYWRLGKFYLGFFLTMLLSALLVVIVCVCVTTNDKVSKTPYCPEGTFPCKQGGCINRTLMCDKIPHCLDHSDEGNWCDPRQDKYWDEVIQKRPDADRETESQECVLPSVPAECECRLETRLYCDDAGLTKVPPDIPHQVTVLDLSGNSLESVTQSDFKNLTNLRELLIMHSKLKYIEKGTFQHNWRLRNVYLTSSELESFPGNVFAPNNRIKELKINHNKISALKETDLMHLQHLESLSLDGNNIPEIQPRVFKWTPTLRELYLSKNRIVSVRNYFFSSMPSLRKLYLEENDIDYIEPGSFLNLTNLATLSLSQNKLQYLTDGIFDGLNNLTTLVLTKNSIWNIDQSTFLPLNNIKSLDLKQNPFVKISPKTFSSLNSLQNIHFDKFYFCAYVHNVIKCEPSGDGISSQENLLENLVLRVSVWIVAVLACAGNIIVLLGRFLLKEDNQIHSFFIKNLSLADMLMGIYLLMIGSKDKMYRGDYLFHDEHWRNSWECDLSGVMSTVSSEVSVLTLTVITLDRYISIMYPLSLRKRGLKVAYCVMGFIWLMCISFAIMPVVGLKYFGTSFYRNNGVCIPLHLHDPRTNGWEYSSFLFIGMNLASFVFISYAYFAMFVSIKHTEIPLRTTRESRERCLVKRFSFIVITDFICWIPIIIIKVVALSGVNISGDLYAWVVVFILPVNSALNPLLYTLTTKLFKQKLISKFTTVVWRPATIRETSHSCASLKGRNSLARNPMQEIELEKLTRKDISSITSTKSSRLNSSYKAVNGVVKSKLMGRNRMCSAQINT
ncbi:relaxin receptor 2 isoform X2 [Patella vulgata]|uniref:relaxin receptor 2 isoform X2 n=1 Tax=Patella vulgata TaxID=6465 RepID=UPI0024A8EC09|nr:relaxin receptor 2 isoform X2 [Patella vulgata]